MSEQLQRDSPAVSQISHVALTGGMMWGFIGGLVGTIVMDLVLIGMLSAAGLPAVISFSTIGDTAAGFFSLIGINVAGGLPLGAAVHYLLGLVLGTIFGAVVARVDALRVNSLRKGVALAVLYIEVVSQPILAMSPILLKMSAAETVQWFGVSAVMHLIWGVVLGALVSYGLRSTTVAKPS
jgi:hypothetical protein